jgi:hypothetical protein
MFGFGAFHVTGLVWYLGSEYGITGKVQPICSFLGGADGRRCRW